MEVSEIDHPYGGDSSRSISPTESPVIINEPYCWLTEDPEDEHNRRCESVLSTLNEDVLQTLDDIALMCLDILLPSVCRGQADEVRVFLNTLADG